MLIRGDDWIDYKGAYAVVSQASGRRMTSYQMAQGQHAEMRITRAYDDHAPNTPSPRDEHLAWLVEGDVGLFEYEQPFAHILRVTAKKDAARGKATITGVIQDEYGFATTTLPVIVNSIGPQTDSLAET